MVKENPFLLLDAEAAKEYFNEYDVFRNIKFQFDETDIDRLYEFARQFNQSCPIVAHIKGVPGHFSFREWVYDVLSEFIDFDLTRTCKYYRGIQNTRLPDEANWFPNTSDDEIVIAWLHNKYNTHTTMTDDSVNITYVTGHIPTEGSKEEQVIEYCNSFVSTVSDDIYNRGYVSDLSADIGYLKKQPFEDNVSFTWEEYGRYEQHGKRPNRTPKTDLISQDGKYKISVKQYGGSQLMSGNISESIATMQTAANVVEEDPNGHIHTELNKIFDDFPDYNKENCLERMKECNIILRNLIVQYPELKRELIIESASGKCKFGEDSNSCANHVYVYQRYKDCKMYTMEEYVDYLMTKYKPDDFNFSYKSATGPKDRYVSLRIG